MNSILIGRAFCRLLAVGRLLHRKFCWFWLFLRDFHFLENQGYSKRSLQKVRDKGVLWTGRVWPIPINSSRTSWKLPPLAKTFIKLDRQYLLVWIWISWKFIHHGMSVSNGWVLSLKIQFLLSIHVSWTSTRLSSHFYPAFRLLRCRKMSE